MDTVLIICALLAALAGVIGCLLPVVPGPPLSLLALVLTAVARDGAGWGALFWVVMVLLTAGLAVADYWLPTLGAKKFGASKAGIWGAVIGMLIGLVLFPPWGALFGAFAGALIGELSTGKSAWSAFKAGWGVILGNLVSASLKLAYAVTVLGMVVHMMFA